MACADNFRRISYVSFQWLYEQLISFRSADHFCWLIQNTDIISVIRLNLHGAS